MNEQKEKWSCPLCTYDNFLASIKCALCLHPRDSAVIQLPPATTPEHGVVIQSRSCKVTTGSALIICPPVVQDGADYKKIDSQAKLLSDKCDDQPHTSSFTAIANTAENMQAWICTECTFANSHAAVQCLQCRTSRPELIETSPSKPCESGAGKDKWTCSVCTYENWRASKYCVVCRTDRYDTSIIQSNDALGIHTPGSETLGTSDHLDIRISGAEETRLHTERCSVQNSSAGVQSPSAVSEICRQDSILSSDTKHPESISKSSSSSSVSSHSPKEDPEGSGGPQPRTTRRRRQANDNQACSSRMAPCSSRQNNSPVGGLSRSSSSSHLYSIGRLEIMDNRSYKNRARNLNWLFVKACLGVVDGNVEAVDAYLTHGGNISRTLTADEIHHLDRPSAFDVGHTLVHLAIRFQRHNILRLLLTPEVAPRDFKRNPAHLSPDIAELIRREISASIRTRKGDFRCHFLSEFTTFQLPVEICDLPASVQKLLFDELLDQDVQKELEEESAINWSPVLMRHGECSNQLYSLWNRSAGDCLLDSVLQATWGVFDRDNVLRSAMSESLASCETSFFRRWCAWEHYQADLLGYSLTEHQCLQDWAFIHSLAQQPGASLEHCHIFVLAHVLRRPIIVYGIKYLKSFRGETLGFARFQGVYLPLLWDQSFCYTSPIALGYTRGHFTALVTMESSVKNICASARHRFQPYNTANYLPLVDSSGKILPLHFTARGEGANEEQRKAILHEWLDCHVTESGYLVAKQRPGKRPSSVTRLVDEWLDHYRHLSFRRLGEEGHSDDDDDD